MGSQFSIFGCKLSPYFSITSGVSTTSDCTAKRLVNRSIFTWVVIRSDTASTSHRKGSIIPWA